MSELRFKEGKNEMIVIKDDTGDLVSVKDQGGNDIEPADISLLKLADESIKKFVLATAPFTIESGELTPSMKVKRKEVIKNYQKDIDAMYE